MRVVGPRQSRALRLVRAFGALVALGLLLPAAGSAVEGAAPAAAPVVELRRPWQTTGVRAVGYSVSADGTVAVIHGTHHSLELVVMDATTGRVRFSRPSWPFGRYYDRMGIGAPVVVPGVLVVLEQETPSVTMLSGLRTADGSPRWRQAVSAASRPFACGAFVCVVEDGDGLPDVVARDPMTGERRWATEGVEGPLDTDGRTLLAWKVGTAPIPPTVAALDVASGAILWHRDLEAALGTERDATRSWSVGLTEGMAIVSARTEADTARTAGVDRVTGDVRWMRLELGRCPVGVPATLLLCGPGRGIRRVDSGTGADTWSAPDVSWRDGLGPGLGVNDQRSALIANGADGAPLLLDLSRGVTSAPAPGATGWMNVNDELEVIPREGGVVRRYSVENGPMHWDVARGVASPAVLDAAQLPEWFGCTVAGYRVYVDGDGVVHGLPVRSA
jgi:hypothetical protein